MNTNTVRELIIPAGLETERFLLGAGALQRVPELLKSLFPGKRPWIIGDDNTWEAAGKKLYQILEDAGLAPLPPYLFPGEPELHGDDKYIPELAELMQESLVPVAVGGGTINDLVKRASFVAGIRYLCIPTACSVDGFTSYGAALLKDGFKQTLPCPAPLGIAADTGVLNHAPSKMFASGYADLAAKIPAGADWIIADELGIEPIREDVWELVQKDLRAWLEAPENQEGIFLGLAATGYSMQLYRESRPASGTEHLFAHALEMEGLHASHGFKVALGTLAATAMYEWLFRQTPDEIKSKMPAPRSAAERANEVKELLKAGCYGENTAQIAMGKHPEPEECTARREQILEHWDQLKKRTKERLIPFDTLREMFRHTGAPSCCADLGITQEHAEHTILVAQLIRNRYTIADVLDDLGLLREAAKYAAERIAK